MRLRPIRQFQLFIGCFLALLTLFVVSATPANAAQLVPHTPAFQLVKRLPLSFEQGCFDGWAQRSSRAYVADPSHRQIDVINLRTIQLEPPLGMDVFPAVHTGPCPGGPLELAIDRDHLWASNETSSLLVFDRHDGTLLRNISTGGQGGTDGLAFDSKDHLMLAANPDESQPFLTLIGAEHFQVLGRLEVPSAGQPIWDAAHQRFLLALPGMANTPSGIAVLPITSPLHLRIAQFWPLANCDPTGLTLGTPGVALVGCEQGGARLLNTQTGQVLAIVPSDGNAVDLVSYDAASQVYALATFGPTTGVVEILDSFGRVEQSIASAPLSHSVFLTHTKEGRTLLFVPENGPGILVYEERSSLRAH